MTTTVEMMKEASEAGQDEAKIKEIEEKYKSEIEACEKMGENMEKEWKDLATKKEKLKEEMEKELEDCPAMKEMQGLMGEMMMNGWEISKIVTSLLISKKGVYIGAFFDFKSQL